MKTAALIAGAFACTMLAGPVAADQYTISPRTLQPIAASGELLISQSAPRLDEGLSFDVAIKGGANVRVANVLRCGSTQSADCLAASGFKQASCNIRATPAGAYW